jgi:hypothetical protein
MAGYGGAAHIDSSGAVWDADRYFQGGRPSRRGAFFTGRTTRPLLFEQWRSGEFSYDIPLKPGVFELHLYFVESGYGPGLDANSSEDTFSVKINGERVLSGFDIESDAMGPNIADERVFKDAIPVDTRGHYTVILHFAEFYFGPQAPGSGGVGNPLFNVMCNGTMLLDHFDVFKEAGSRHAIGKTFYHIRPTAQGKLNLTFEPVVCDHIRY